jgi:predicted TIM-barrel fold metal-dependent hydrolase
MTRPCLGPDRNTRRPDYRAPPGACDCHAHVFGPPALYPYVEERSFTPPDAPVSAYLRMLDAIGVERGVLVQGSVHGTDNRLVAASVSSAPQRLRGVAVIGPHTPDEEIRALHAQGFRGARLSTVVKGTPSFDFLETIAAKVKPYGWHIVVHVNKSDELVALAPRLVETGSPLLIDHIARVRLDQGTAAPGFRTLLQLLHNGNCWVKISGQHRMSRQDYPWADMRHLVRGVIEARPDRVLWGTDWPHPNQYDGMQNDGDLLDAFAQWVPEEALRKQVLVDNPQALYEF